MSLRALSAALAAAAVAASIAPAVAQADDRSWLERRVINMTHQGGENEHPSGTMYALRESLGLGADTLELDVQPTRDGTLMVLHDASVERTTGAAKSVYDMTVEEVQALDAAYNFVPGRGTVRGLDASAYPLRGVRTGEKAPPLGYTAEDFRIPTLEEVLRAFPDVPMNVEIKGRSDADNGSFIRNAEHLARLLDRVPYPPLVVASFNEDAIDRFHALKPEVGVAPGILGAAVFLATSLTRPGSVALQVPPELSGLTIVTPDFVRRAHAAGQAVHVWFSGTEESERVYGEMLDMGVDGLMPAKPRALERFMCARGTPRLPGNPNHCEGGAQHAAQHCVARVARVSKAVRGGRSVTVTLRRGADAKYECEGRVTLRGRSTGRGSKPGSFGSARFKFPYGISETQAVVDLGPRTRAKLGRARSKKLAAAAAARVDGQARDRARRVTLRR